MKYINHLKRHFSSTTYLRSIAIALFLFFIALVINYYAGTYATREASKPVTDIVLSNTRVYDVDGLFVYGTFVGIIFVTYLVFRNLNQLPYVIESIALFTVIRSVFICLTHIAPFPTKVVMDSDLLSRITFGGDLFFSGHTGLPFLLALIYWENVRLRYIFLGFAAMFGCVVLLGHLHYSIDVLSAFFITYTIHHIGQRFFKKERLLFHEGLVEQK